jgi:hypothetical protein
VKELGNEITRLASTGIPARDIFTQIGEAQQKIDQRIEDMKTKFADVPIVFNRLLDLQRSIGGGEFLRGFDNTVRGIQKLAQPTATVEDEFGNLLETAGKIKQGFGETTAAANDLAVVMGNIPQAIGPLESGFVIVTGRIRELAEAFAAASREAIFFETVVGSANAGAATAPGNF